MPYVLMGTGPEQVGGAEVRASILARNLSERGYRVSFVVGDYGQPTQSDTGNGIEIFTGGRKCEGKQLGRLLFEVLPADARAFRAADADVYVEFGISWRSGLLARKCRKEGRKYILWLASITDPYVTDGQHSRMARHERWLAHRGLRDAELVVAQTKEQRDAMKVRYDRDCPVVPNIWEITSISEVKSSPPEVFWAARYIPLKRPELVLEVAKLVPEVQFTMAGGASNDHPELFEETQRAAEDIPNVQIVGFVPFKDIDQYFARASCYLCTSTIEGFPNTFLQTWNHKTPVVSTFDPDNVLSEHNIGIHCQDVAQIADGVRRACGDEGKQMGARARAYLEQVHGEEAIMSLLEPLLTA